MQILYCINGFPIEIKQVINTLLIGTNSIVTIAEAPARLSRLFDKLLLYAHTHRLSTENLKTYDVFPAGKDQREVGSRLITTEM
ncbi:MAG TPA: hypothetical protein PLL71_00495 [Agriterribacter sp.]|nr:hypothetical protein [Agriterribacter sp.]HRQ48937.1 hypothetical protein [Agriterribacter sp.]